GQSSRSTRSTTNAQPSSRPSWGAQGQATASNDSRHAAPGGSSTLCTRPPAASIIDLLVAEGIGTLILGQNPLWKQEATMWRRTNQQLVAIPHVRFGAMLRYKAELVGIGVLLTEESSIRKASFLDTDPLPIFGEGKVPGFSGRRVKRGLYRAADETSIHADVNGAYNLIRKVAPEAFAPAAQGSSGCVVHPMRLTGGRINQSLVR